MLTAEHIEARLKDGEVVLRRLDARAIAAAVTLAGEYLEDARAHVGRTREELEEAWALRDAAARPKVAAGLQKLVTEHCVFDEETERDPAEIRHELFVRAARMRRERGAIDRGAVVAEASAALALDPARVESLLFADRHGEHVLRAAPPPHVTAEGLVQAYETGRAQAVLLRAVRVTCDVSSSSPGVLRAFFAKLKFHQLLFTIERRAGGLLRVILDGPYSMFDAVTRYGLRLALILPALREVEAWTLEAEVRWGKERAAARFALAQGPSRVKDRAAAPASAAPSNAANASAAPSATASPLLSSDVAELLRALEAARSPWRAAVADDVLEVPGQGVVVPDLVLRRHDGAVVHVEVLGHWSRDAVWRRVELAEKGLAGGANIVFCVPSRLRVSEAVLTQDAHAALYVFKTKMSARALLDRVERLYAARPCTSSSREPRAGSAKPSPGSI